MTIQPKQTKNERTVLICPVLLLSIVLSGLGCWGPTLIPSSTPVPSRKVVSQTFHLQEKWRAESGQVGGGLSSHAWQVTDRGLVYANAGGQLVLLSGRSGETLWQVTYDKFWDAASLVADEERVYLVTVGEWRIKTYSLTDGQLTWQTEELTSHTEHNLYLEDGLLLEYESSSRNGNFIRTFNPENGIKLDTEKLPEDSPYILALAGNVYLGTADGWLWAIDRANNKPLWHIPAPMRRIRPPPVVVNDLLVVANGSDLQVLKLWTGEILWQKQAYALSNPVVWENVVYVIAEDASIRAHDLISGRELGRVEMSPAVTTPATDSYALTVNAGDGSIYAYYGDSEEIIAFGR